MKVNKNKAKSIKQNKSTNVGYSGEVTITLYKNNKKYKEYVRTNHGQLNLFRYLANALNMKLIPELRPTLIQLIGEDEDQDERLILQTPQPLIRSTVGETEDKAYIIFEFLIPYTNLLITNSTAIKKLILTSSAGIQNVVDPEDWEAGASALIELDPRDPVEVEQGIDLRISWVLQLQQVNEI